MNAQAKARPAKDREAAGLRAPGVRRRGPGAWGLEFRTRQEGAGPGETRRRLRPFGTRRVPLFTSQYLSPETKREGRRGLLRETPSAGSTYFQNVL